MPEKVKTRSLWFLRRKGVDLVNRKFYLCNAKIKNYGKNRQDREYVGKDKTESEIS